MKDEEMFEIFLLKRNIEGARQAAVDCDKDEGEYVVTLSRFLAEPFLTFVDC